MNYNDLSDDEHMNVHLELCRRVFNRMMNDGTFETEEWKNRKIDGEQKQDEDEDWDNASSRKRIG